MSEERSKFRLITPIARLSYPHLFHPQKAMDADGKDKYGCELIFPPGTDLSALRAAANGAAVAKWGAAIPKKLRNPFRDGDEDREGKDGYAGCAFIGARCADKPGIVIGQNKDICTDESQIYGGCYVRASVTAFGYHHKKGGMGVSFALNNVWKLRDGEPFGNRVPADQDFADCDADAEAFGADTSYL